MYKPLLILSSIIRISTIHFFLCNATNLSAISHANFIRVFSLSMMFVCVIFRKSLAFFVFFGWSTGRGGTGIIANSPVAMVIVVVPMVHLQISSIKTFCTNGINATFSEKEYLALTPPKMIMVCLERILAWATKLLGKKKVCGNTAGKEEGLWKHQFTHLVVDEMHKANSDGQLQ